MSIPRDTIELIRDRLNIEDVIKKYVPTLKKRGRNFVGLCPFHKEKTPSFTVSPEKQIFYCFGCHVGGNVFSFISRIERLNFPESVKFLGKITGIEIKDSFDRNDEKKYDGYFRINSLAMTHFQRQLHSEKGRVCVDYLKKRGVSDTSIKEFNLGYAHNEWNSLSRFLQNNKVDMTEAINVGLISQSQKGDGTNFYDRFRGRVIFPIINTKGNVVAFGGRVIGEGEPKYLNSPESLLFNKGSVLYGLNLARPHIYDLKRVIIVEGYLDVIGCHQNGIRNVVAPLGTALTERQVGILSRLCKEIILLFDADQAGVNASLRTLDVAKKTNVDVRVAVLPESDPFDFILKNGAREFMAIIDTALKPVDFKLKRVMLSNDNPERIDKMIRAFEIINEIEYETEKGEYLKKLNSMIGGTESEIRSDFKKFQSKKTRAGIPPKSNNEKSTRSGNQDFPATIFRELVLLMSHYPEIIEQALIDISEDVIEDSISKNIFCGIKDLFARREKVSIDRLFDIFQEGNEKDFLENNLFKEYTIESPRTAYTEIYINLKLYLIDLKINKFADELKRTGAKGESKARDYLAEIEVLRREREKLASYLYNKDVVIPIQ